MTASAGTPRLETWRADDARARAAMRRRARSIHVGRQTATAEGRLVDAGGKPYAHATTTCLVFEVRGPSK